MSVQSPSACALFLCCFFSLLAPVPQHQSQSEVAPPSKSDTYAVAVSGEKERAQHREVARANFRISGVDLASNEDVLLSAEKTLGKSPIESSGDASTGNDEACYKAASDRDNTRLVFGRGELDSWFTLSSGGPAGEGIQICKRSEKVTRDIASESGLRLGLSKRQVLSILGLATEKHQNLRQHTETLVYSLESKGKTDPRRLAQWWQQEIKKNPTANRDEFLENYEFYALAVSISARFVNDSLTRLHVSWSAQY